MGADFQPPDRGSHRGPLTDEVTRDVVRVVGAEVTVLSRLSGGVNAGALRIQVAGS